MSAHGLLPTLDYAIFADTGWEPKEVYDHLKKLHSYVEPFGIPILTVSNGNIREDALNEDGHRFASMPLFTKDENGKVSILRRQCSREYKIQPVRKKLRELGATSESPFSLWMGISVDEIKRMSFSDVKYVEHKFPLIEKRMDRNDCLNYLKLIGWTAPKSACIGCPFHDNRYWQRMQLRLPEEFHDAVDFDKRIRNNPRLRDETYLHPSAIALDEVDFEKSPDQQDLFDNECLGTCGL